MLHPRYISIASVLEEYPTDPTFATDDHPVSLGDINAPVPPSAMTLKPIHRSGLIDSIHFDLINPQSSPSSDINIQSPSIDINLAELNEINWAMSSLLRWEMIDGTRKTRRQRPQLPRRWISHVWQHCHTWANIQSNFNARNTPFISGKWRISALHSISMPSRYNGFESIKKGKKYFKSTRLKRQLMTYQ